MCVDALVGMIAKIKCLGNNDREVLRNLKQFQNYMQSVPVFSMRTIISELKFSDSLKVVLLLLPFQVENKRIHLDTMYTKQCDSNYHEILRWLTNDQFIEKENLCRVVELSCAMDIGFSSVLPNLKVIKNLRDVNDESLKQLTEECPLLEVFECSRSTITTAGLMYFCSLSNLKSVQLFDFYFTSIGVVQLLKKCDTKIQEISCAEQVLDWTIDTLYYQYDIIPSIKSLGFFYAEILSKVLRVFPEIENMKMIISDPILSFSLRFSEYTKIKYLEILRKTKFGLSSCFDINIMLKFFQKVFSGMMSFTFNCEHDCECSNKIVPETPPIQSRVTRLQVLGDYCANLLSPFMGSNNNIKVLVLESLSLFVDERFKSCLENLKHVEVIEVNIISYDFSLIDKILKSLPSLRVFKCDWSFFHNFEKLRLDYMSNSYNKVKFISIQGKI